MSPRSEAANPKAQAEIRRHLRHFHRLEKVVSAHAHLEDVQVPKPPGGVYPFRHDPMTFGEVLRFIDRYNRHAIRWNRAELGDESIELSPPLEFAEVCHWVGYPKSDLLFQMRGDSRFCVMRIAGWQEFGNGAEHQLIDIRRVIWAGRERLHPDPDDSIELIREAARKRPRSYWRAGPQWKEPFQ